MLAMFVATLLSQAQSNKVVHAGTLLAVPGEGVQTEKTIVIKNGRIASIEEGYKDLNSLGLTSENTEVIDLKDQFVMPGFIDMHVHITSERDPNANPHEWTTLSDEDLAFNALPHLKSTLEAGFTTVRDLGANASTINALKRAVSEGLVSGPRIIASNSAVSATGGHGDFHGYRSEIKGAFGKDNPILKCNQ